MRIIYGKYKLIFRKERHNHMHTHTQTMHMHTWGMHMHLGFRRLWKESFLHINSCGTNPTLFGSRPTPLFYHYRKPLKHFFKRRQNIEDSLENSESKREFFTKHPQVKFYLVETYFCLSLWLLKLTNLLVLLLIRLIEGNS